MYNPDEKMNQTFGTPYYIAPEVINKEYDEKCDMWSSGVILYVLLSGAPPFDGKNDHSILRAVKKAQLKFDSPVWQTISKEAKDLLGCLIMKDAKKRLSAQEAFEHPWIKKFTKTKI